MREMAHAYAQLHNRDETLRYVEAAERSGRASSRQSCSIPATRC